MQSKDEQQIALVAQDTSAVSSISRSTDALLARVSAALKTVPLANYSEEEVRRYTKNVMLFTLLSLSHAVD